MNFITKLFNAHNYNVICTIINRFNKKRDYVFWTTKNENINAKITIWIFIQHVFQIHNFLLLFWSKFSIYFVNMTNFLQNFWH